MKVVAIVGRQNVGKSTLFNRLTESRHAITSDIAGTTRDWLEGLCHWGAKTYRVVDTGGYAPGTDAVLSAVRGQVGHWIAEADAIFWVLDGQTGLSSEDRDMAQWLRPQAQKVTVVVNKLDDAQKDATLADFYRLGFPHVLGVSAVHGRRVNDLLDHLESVIKDPPSAPAEKTEEVAVAILGRPNVGKSSLLNAILGSERSIVSEIAGTTRDSVDTDFVWERTKYRLIDTAGLRAKKSAGSQGLEGLTRLMTEKALARAEVALLLLDASEGLTEGDVSVGRLIEGKRKACVVGVNKWDVVQEKSRFMKWYEEHAATDMPFLAWCPLVFLSAKTQYHLPELLAALKSAREQFHRRFDGEDLTAFFWSQVQERPYTHRGKKLVFKKAEQLAEAPPTLSLQTNMREEDVHFSYQRRLENNFREHYKLAGTPLVLRFQKR